MNCWTTLSGLRTDKRLTLVSCMTALVLSLVCTGVALARPGDQDTTFNGTGKATVEFSSGNFDEGHALAVDSSGRPVIAGSTAALGGNPQFAIARFNTTGGADSAFSGDGKQTVDFGLPSEAWGVAIHPVGDANAGKIVVAGRSYSAGYWSIALARLNADGSLDTGFGTSGLVVTDLTADAGARAVAIQPDGKIVVAGYCSTGWLVARYNADGSPDGGFGSSGIVKPSMGSDLDTAYAVAIQPSTGKIAVAGNSDVPTSWDFAMVLLETNGSESARDTEDFSGNDTAYGVSFQSDGRIVVAGRGNNDFAVVRYSAGGTLDGSFGSGGRVTTDMGSTNDTARSVAIQTGEQSAQFVDKIVVAGYRSYVSSTDLAVVRYDANGALDSSFGTSGKVSTNISGSSDDRAFGVATKGDRIFTGGATDGGSSDLAVVTYILSGAPSVTLQPLAQTVCVGSGATFTASAYANPVATVQWEKSSDEGVSWTAIAGATATTYSPLPVGTDDGMLIHAKFTNNAGVATTDAVRLTVNTLPVVDTHPLDQSGDPGATVTFTAAATSKPAATIQWERSTDGGSAWSDIEGATSGTFSITADAAQNGNKFRARFTNLCSVARSNPATFTLNIPPVVTTPPAAATVCENSAASFTVVAGGYPVPTVQWQSSPDGTTWGNITGANSLTYSFTPDAAQHGNRYRAVLTNHLGSVNSDPALLTVNTGPTVTTSPVADVTVTVGGTVTLTAAATGRPTPTVQWEESSNGGTTWTPIGGATSTSYSFAAQEGQQGHKFRAKFTTSCATASSGAATLTVNTPPNITTQPFGKQICEGTDVSFTAAASGSPTPTVVWERSTDNGASWTSTGATTTTYTVNALGSMDGYLYRAVFSNGISPAATSNVALLMVDTKPSITTQPSNRTVTSGNTVEFTAAASGRPTPTVQWYRSTDGNSWSSIGGATSTSYSFTAAADQNGYKYKAVFTNTCAVTPVESNDVTLTVNTVPAVGTHPASQTVCEGSPVAFTAAASSGFPSPTVQWQVSSGGAFTDISGATSTTYTIPSAVAGQNGYRYRAAFTNDASTVYSNSATLTVNWPTNVTTHPASQSVTAGDPVTLTVSASGNPAPSIQWEQSTDNGASWSSIGGATASSYSFTALASQNGHRFRASLTSSCGASPVKSNAATLTVNVNVAPTVATQPTARTVCEGSATSFIAAADGFPTPTVRWQVSADGSGWADVPGATTPTYSFTPLESQHGYRYRAIFTNGSGTATTDPALLTVNLSPQVTQSPANATVTAGVQVTLNSAATGRPTPSVQWQESVDGISWGDIGGATSVTYGFTPTAAQNGHRFRARFTGSCGIADTAPAVLTVNSLPDVTTHPASQTVCEGTSVSLTASAGGLPAPTLQWQSSPDGITWSTISGATSSPYSFVSGFSQNGYRYRASFTNVAGTRYSDPAVLTVNSTPSVSAHPASQSVTVGSQVTFSAAATSSPAPTVLWEYSSDGGNSWSTISGANSPSYSFTAGLAQNGNRYRARFTNSCSLATTNAAVLTVRTAPTVNWATPANIVYGTALSSQQLNATASVAGTFQYTPALGSYLNAGTGQTLSATFTPDDQDHYAVVTSTVPINVSKAPLTATAENKVRYRGEGLPTFTLALSGFVRGEGSGVLGGTLVFDVVTVVVDQSYSIVPSGLTAANYAINYVSGTMTMANRESDSGGSSGSSSPTQPPSQTTAGPVGTPGPVGTTVPPSSTPGPASPTPVATMPTPVPMPSLGPTVQVTPMATTPPSVPTVTGDGIVGQLPPEPGTGAVTVGDVSLQVDNRNGSDLLVRMQPEQPGASTDPGTQPVEAFHLEVYVRPEGSDSYQKSTDTHVLLSRPFSRTDYEALIQQGKRPTFQLLKDDGTIVTIETFWSAEPAPGVVWADVVPQSLYRLVIQSTAPAATPSSGTPAAAGRNRTVPADERYFAETGYRINTDAFWDYYQKRGGTRAFGYPVSREFTLGGFTVQLYQRALLQLMPDGGVARMNLLDSGLLPYTRINTSTFPGPDRELMDGAPNPASSDYADMVMKFVEKNVSDEWEGIEVNFLQTLMSTVRFEDAFPGGVGEPSLLPLMNLEIWGLPTSKPQRDPNNGNFVYQRFQRGIMHYDATTGATQGLLLGDYVKSLMTGKELPPDLEQQARSSNLYRQYDLTKPQGIARPESLAGSNLQNAFEPETVVR